MAADPYTMSGEHFSYGTMADALSTVNSPESLVIADTIKSNLEEGNLDPDSTFNRHMDHLEADIGEVKEAIVGEIEQEEFDDALDYLTSEPNEERLRSEPDVRAMNLDEEVLELPHMVLERLGNLIGGADLDMDKINELRNRGKIPSDEYSIVGRYIGDPGFAEIVEEEAQKAYRWRDERLGNAIHTTFFQEGSDVEYRDGRFTFS